MAPPRGRGAPGRTGSSHRFTLQQSRSTQYKFNPQDPVKLRNSVTPSPPLQYGGARPVPPLTETKNPEGAQHTPDRKQLVNLVVDTGSQLQSNLEKIGKRVKFTGAPASAAKDEPPAADPSLVYDKITLKSFPELTIEFAVGIADSTPPKGASFRAVPAPVPYQPPPTSASEEARSLAAAADVTGTLMPIEETVGLARFIAILQDYEWQLQQFYIQELPVGSRLEGYQAISVDPAGNLTFWLRPPSFPIEDVTRVDTPAQKTSLAVLQARAAARKRPQLVLVKRDWKTKITAIDKCFPGGNFALLAPAVNFPDGVNVVHSELHRLLEAGTAPGETKIIEMRLWNEYVTEAHGVERQDRGVYDRLAAMSNCSGIVIKGNRPVLLRYHEFISELYKEHPEYFHRTDIP